MPVPAFDALLRDLDQGTEGEQVRAIRALGRGDAARAVPVLVEALQHPAPRVHREAITVLARLGIAAAPALLTALQAGPLNASARVVEALSRSSDPEVAPTLLRALQLRELAPEAQERIAEALARLADRKAAPVLLEALQFRYLPPEAHDRIADALARCGAHVVPRLLELLRGSDAGLRADAVEILIRMADEHPTPALAAAVPELRRRLGLWAAEHGETVPRIYVALGKIEALSFSHADLPLPASAPAIKRDELPIPSAGETAGD